MITNTQLVMYFCMTQTFAWLKNTLSIWGRLIFFDYFWFSFIFFLHFGIFYTISPISYGHSNVYNINKVLSNINVLIEIKNGENQHSVFERKKMADAEMTGHTKSPLYSCHSNAPVQSNHERWLLEVGQVKWYLIKICRWRHCLSHTHKHANAPPRRGLRGMRRGFRKEVDSVGEEVGKTGPCSWPGMYVWLWGKKKKKK